MNENQTKGILKWIKENWVIIAFLVSIITGWTNFDNRITNVEASQVKQDSSIENIKSTQNTLSAAVIEIKANYLFIKDILTELRDTRK